jgi:glycerol-3-phosphate acyltransferase PlsY
VRTPEAGLALIRSLVDWLPQSATWVGILAGPLVLLGYLVGALPFDYFVSRRHLRRQLDDPHGSPRPAPLPPADPLDTPGVVLTAALGVAATLLVSTVAWDLALAAAPNSRFSPSSVGAFSNQVIAAWVSVALWTGLAAVVGHVAPAWSSFRGGTGAVPAAALLFAYAPTVFGVAVGVFLVTMGVTARPRLAVPAAAAAAVTYEYLAWVADLPHGWGVTNGPELALWTAGLAGVVLAGTLRRPPAPA